MLADTLLASKVPLQESDSKTCKGQSETETKDQFNDNKHEGQSEDKHTPSEDRPTETMQDKQTETMQDNQTMKETPPPERKAAGPYIGHPPTPEWELGRASGISADEAALLFR